MVRLVVGAGLHYEYLRTASSIWVWVWLLAAPIMPISAVVLCWVLLVGPEFGPEFGPGKPAQNKTGTTSLNSTDMTVDQLTGVLCCVGYTLHTPVPFERYHHLH